MQRNIELNMVTIYIAHKIHADRELFKRSLLCSGCGSADIGVIRCKDLLKNLKQVKESA